MCLAVSVFPDDGAGGSTLFADDARLMRMSTAAESTGPGLDERRINTGSRLGVKVGVNRCTELDRDLVPGKGFQHHSRVNNT